MAYVYIKGKEIYFEPVKFIGDTHGTPVLGKPRKFSKGFLGRHKRR